MTDSKKGFLCKEEQYFWEKEKKAAVTRDSIRDLFVNCLAAHRRYRYFEGWYYKHQNADTVLAFIPGQSIDENGKKHPYLQIIWNEKAYSLNFKKEDYLVDRRQSKVIIGNNIFSQRGIKINIRTKEIHIQGVIRYGALSPLNYSIMGPFEFIPFMECRHEIISMDHSLQGKVTINGKLLDFHGEKGYIEGDKGISFPSDYLWLQCNGFREDAAIMAAIAHIPFMGLNFQGCICVILYKGKEYRFTTYLGAKVVCKRETAIVLKQGNYCLKVYLSNQKGNNETGFSHKLLAPSKGKMSRFIRERHLLPGRFLLYKKDKLIFDLTSRYVSFEYEEGLK